MRAFAIAALLLSTVGSAVAQDMTGVQIRVQDLGSGIYMLEGRGGNIGLSTGPDGALLVDDQFAPLAPKIRSAIEEMGGESVRFVLNTHWHSDHTGGNESFGEAGALIVAHDHVRKRMSSPQYMKAFDRHVPASAEVALPIVTFGRDLTLHLNGHEIHVSHVASAHTDGDAIVHFRDANILHMGDTFVSGMYPFIDISSGGSLDGVVAALRSGLALSDEDTKIIPGHGPLSGRKELEASLKMLITVRDRVRAASEDGQTREQVAASDLIRDLDPAFGGGFLKADQFLGIVYDSLASP